LRRVHGSLPDKSAATSGWPPRRQIPVFSYFCWLLGTVTLTVRTVVLPALSVQVTLIV
jgi:hypothetical protein